MNISALKHIIRDWTKSSDSACYCRNMALIKDKSAPCVCDHCDALAIDNVFCNFRYILFRCK